MLDVVHAVTNSEEQTVQEYENLATHAMIIGTTSGKDSILLGAIFGRKLPICNVYTRKSLKRVKL
jgi:hypothetical protein